MGYQRAAVRFVAFGCLAMTLSMSALAFDYNDAIRGVLENQRVNSKPAETAPVVSANTTRLENLRSAEVSSGLKQALTRGAEVAVAQLGQQDGFFGNPTLKIPLPPALKKTEKALRMLGMGQQADDLVLAMNRAAEAAVPEAQSLLINAVKAMSLQDAKGILMGGNTSATDFFRSKTETTLVERFLPIVKTTTDQSRLAQQYNSYAGMAVQFGMGKKTPVTVEDYVARQALDRLYRVIGEQERWVRANPLQAGTELMKKVFGAAMGN